MVPRAVKMNPELYWKLLNRPLVDIAGCKTIYTGIASPWLNGVQGGSPTDVDAILDYFAEKNCPFSWWVGENDIKPHGLDYFGKSLGMHLDLNTLKTVTNSALTIELVSDRETLQEFLRVLMQAYDAPDETFDALLPLFLEAGLSFPRLHFIGKIEGKVVTVCSLYIDPEGVASLFNVGSLPSYRGQGYASALICSALKQCKAPYAALTAFPEATNLYLRLGFKATYSFDIFIKN